MTDMPDTTLTSDPSHAGSGHPETDDAAGYYTPGSPLAEPGCPGPFPAEPFRQEG